MTRESYGLQSVGVYIDQATRTLLGKRGFWNADIIAHWDEIVGQELSQGIRPDKITYPKGKGGVVHLRVAGGAFAVMAEHKKREILDRLNTFVGSQAFEDIKMTQGANLHPKKEEAQPVKKAITPEQEKELERILAHIRDPQLKEALFAYGKALWSK
ncbi:MAG: DUF721 domain-containing protein [Alphaproteobacteria bacterium]|nr:DUF721 domain-containing protein [Alphaproteobacteria bacterium]